MTCHLYRFRTHIEDTDFSGFVFHARYLHFFERARSEWAIDLGLDMHWQHEHGVMLVVQSLSIDYLKPVRLHQEFEVVSEILEIGGASITYSQHLRLVSEPDSIMTRLKIKVVCVSREKMTPVRLPAHHQLEAMRRVL